MVKKKAWNLWSLFGSVLQVESHTRAALVVLVLAPLTAMPDVPATPRRSRRFQPLVQSSTSTGTLENFDYRWEEDEPVHSRQLIPELDLLEYGEEASSDTQLHFHSAFTRYSKSKKQKKERQGTRYAVGDTVLVKTDTGNSSVGVIIAMWEAVSPAPELSSGEGEEEEECTRAPVSQKRIRLRWFLRKEQLPKFRSKRDEQPNEVYFTLEGTKIESPDVIKSHCELNTQHEDTYDEDASSSGLFFCKLAVDGRRAIFYNLDWVAHRATALRNSRWDDFTAWSVRIEEFKPKSKPTTKKKKADAGRRGKRVRASEHEEGESDSDMDQEDDEEDEDDFFMGNNEEEEDKPDDDELDGDESEEEEDGDMDEDEDEDVYMTSSTPGKRRLHGSPSKRTPFKRRTFRAQPTPHSKAALHKRRNHSRNSGVYKKLVFNIEAGPDDAEFQSLPPDPWLRAMHTLHIANRPRGAALPCREQEFGEILTGLQGILEEGTGGCIYVSGVPGTGKTATVHAVVRQLKRMAEKNETIPFTYVEINGLKLTDPAAAYSLLWESLLGEDKSAAKKGAKSHKEALKSLTSYFSGKGRGPVEHACVVLMDELDQLMTTNQDVIYNFFNWPMLACSRLVVLAVANTMDLPERVMTGRVRSRLGMVRINFSPYKTPQLQKIVQARLDAAKESFAEGHEGRTTVVLNEDAVKLAAMKTSSVSGDARRALDVCRRAIEVAQSTRKTATQKDVNEIIIGVQSSPAFALVRSCTFHQRVMLAAILKCIKKTGLEAVKWDEVQDQHLSYASVLSTSRGRDKVTANELLIVLNSLVSSRAIIIERDKNVTKDMGARKLMLNVDTTDVERVLADEGGTRWSNLL